MWKNTITKLIRIFTVVFLITELLSGQDILWQRVFDTGEADHARGVTTDSEGNIIISGQSSCELSGGDCLTIKYSPDGDTLWTEWYDTTFYNGVNAITSDRLDNIIIAGYIWTDSTNSDMHIVKYDSGGNILWTRTYSNGENVGEFCYGVATDSKNNIIVTGTVHCNWGDYITLKYDSNGNFLWKREYDGDWEDYAQDVAVDDSDNIIVTGYSDSDINWDWCTIKYSPDGDILWIRRYDVALTDWAFGIATDKDNNVIVVGETHQLLPGTGGCSAMVVKYSPQGDTLWTKIFTDTLQYAELGTFADVVADDYGNIYLAGEFAWWNDKGQLWKDYYIAKCASSGDTVWTKRCSYGGINEPSRIALDQSGNIIVTGSTYPGPEQSLRRDFFTIKLQNATNNIEELPSIPEHFALYQNYPNPFNPVTNIKFDLPEDAHVTLTIYDINGREVAQLVNQDMNAGYQHITWNAKNKFGHDVASGFYICQMRTSTGFIKTNKMVLMR